MMDEPWFERWGMIGYRPVHPKGRLVVLLMVVGFIVLVSASIVVRNEYLASVFGWSAFGVGALGHLLVVTHMRER